MLVQNILKVLKPQTAAGDRLPQLAAERKSSFTNEKTWLRAEMGPFPDNPGDTRAMNTRAISTIKIESSGACIPIPAQAQSKGDPINM